MKSHIRKLKSLADKLEALQNEASKVVLDATKNPFNFQTPTPENLRALAKKLEKP